MINTEEIANEQGKAGFRIPLQGGHWDGLMSNLPGRYLEKLTLGVECPLNNDYTLSQVHVDGRQFLVWTFKGQELVIDEESPTMRFIRRVVKKGTPPLQIGDEMRQFIKEEGRQ